VGCSGWNYAWWRGCFYPAELPQRRWLAYYAEQFDTVEINNTFYRLPERSRFAAWRSAVAGDFVYAIKASRFLTHIKRLREPREPLDRLFERAAGLGRRLGPVLYQLPATMTRDLPRLDALLEALPARRRHVLEFRHESWYVDAVFERLAGRRVALCLHDRAGSAVATPLLGPFVYVRFHGPAGTYQGRYDDAALEHWAERLAAERARGRDVFAYFNNDAEGNAPRDAARLRELMSTT
jgi:uncharacterized protein YecE (DUF72 family)